MESFTVPFSVSVLLPLAIAILIVPTIIRHFLTSRSALNGIPGPFLAQFTNLWRFWMVFKGKHEQDIIKLHRRYGKTVRLGPNCVSLGDIDTIKKVYLNKGVTKSDMYHPSSFVQDRQTVQTLFSTQDEAAHAYMFRPIARLYTLANVLKHENLIDSALEGFFHQLDERFVSTGAICPMDDWLSYYAWDIVGELTFSERFGFMETGVDRMELIRTNKAIVGYLGLFSQIPVLDRFLDKNPVIRIGPPSATETAAFVAGRYFKRMAERAQEGDFEHSDMMDSFVAIKMRNPEIPDPLVISWAMMNVLAGSDTTRCVLVSAVYSVLKDEKVYAKLRKELDDEKVRPTTSWKTLQQLPYLNAVIREAMRIHPPVGVNLERVLPQSLTLPDGRSLPAGTILGINPWVTSRDSVYGEDVDKFVPERWLKRDKESDEEFDARLGAMNSTDLVFGFGKRACYGKPIALLELYKTIAALFSTYNMSFANPDEEWYMESNFFVMQKGVNIRLEKRVR